MDNTRATSTAFFPHQIVEVLPKDFGYLQVEAQFHGWPNQRSFHLSSLETCAFIQEPYEYNTKALMSFENVLPRSDENFAAFKLHYNKPNKMKIHFSETEGFIEPGSKANVKFTLLGGFDPQKVRPEI